MLKNITKEPNRIKLKLLLKETQARGERIRHNIEVESKRHSGLITSLTKGSLSRQIETHLFKLGQSNRKKKKIWKTEHRVRQRNGYMLAESSYIL